MSEVITVNLKIWRQEGPDKDGHFEEYAQQVTTEASFLETVSYTHLTLPTILLV